jgi:glycosyltransferase involved in cell wall biosynthesis
MNVTWLAFDDISATAAGWYSPVASLRFRMLIPLPHLEALGHGVTVVRVGPEDRLEEVTARASGDVVVFSKVMNPGDEAFRRLARLALDLQAAVQRDGRKVVVDICDDLFGVPVYGEFLRALTEGADLVVGSSEPLAELVRARFSRPARVAEDPFEGERGEPRFAPPPRRARGLIGKAIQHSTRPGAAQRALRLLWFGHGSNLPAAMDFIPELQRLVGRYTPELTLVTTAESGAPGLCEAFNAEHGALCRLNFTPWSPEAMRLAMTDCDAVVIPTRLDDPTKLVKSSNRLVQALWAGRFVIAHPVESYRALGAHAWIGTDLVAGIEWALDNPREVTRRLAAGQEYVANRYSPAVIASQWAAALAKAVEA